MESLTNNNDQLLTETTPDANIVYVYNDNGNLVSKTDANDAKNACQPRGFFACTILCLGAAAVYRGCVILCRMTYELACQIQYSWAVEKCDKAKAFFAFL